ncbi:hypothetical protein C0J52_01203 [Blattella germanica]|nr:hypothetical protein C0J52_01203 [Blattella germanica]
MKVFHMIDEDDNDDGEPRAPTASVEDDDVDDDLSSYCCDNIGKGRDIGGPPSSGMMPADIAATGPLLGVGGFPGGGRSGAKTPCTLVRVSTYASSLNQPTVR